MCTSPAAPHRRERRRFCVGTSISWPSCRIQRIHERLKAMSSGSSMHIFLFRHRVPCSSLPLRSIALCLQTQCSATYCAHLHALEPAEGESVPQTPLKTSRASNCDDALEQDPAATVSMFVPRCCCRARASMRLFSPWPKYSWII